MYLAIMLILVSIIVFYNEYQPNMHIAEKALLLIALIAIIRAAVNYIQLDTPINESFSINYKPKVRGKYKKQDILLDSKDIKEYLDTDMPSHTPTKAILNSSNGKINTDAVDQVNSLLGISNFDNVNNLESLNSNTSGGKSDSKIESIFNPQIIIGKSADDTITTNDNCNNKWNSVFTNDGMTFKNTMAPSKNLWHTSNNISGDDYNWTQNLNDYNNGKWIKPPSSYKIPQTKEQIKTEKQCGTDKSDDLVINNYTESKKFYPGYTYVPPVYWDIPQRHVSMCNPPGENYQKLTGLMDRGLPMNVLELNQDGSQATTEETVKLTNVGSMLSRFNYQEQPFSKPYV